MGTESPNIPALKPPTRVTDGRCPIRTTYYQKSSIWASYRQRYHRFCNVWQFLSVGRSKNIAHICFVRKVRRVYPAPVHRGILADFHKTPGCIPPSIPYAEALTAGGKNTSEEAMADGRRGQDRRVNFSHLKNLLSMSKIPMRSSLKPGQVTLVTCTLNHEPACPVSE